LIKSEITERQLENILDIVIDSKETNQLKQEMYSLVKAENENLHLVKFQNNSFSLLLNCMLEDI